MLLEFLSLQVPHSLALLEQHDLICIADREDMRVVCRGAELSTESKEQAPLTIQQPDLGRVYAITNHGMYFDVAKGWNSWVINVSFYVLLSYKRFFFYFVLRRSDLRRQRTYVTSDTGTRIYHKPYDREHCRSLDTIKKCSELIR